LPQEIVARIADRTDGVPLFVEELTKAVVESGMLTDAGDRYTAAGPVPALAIPASLQASLLARLDRLAPVRERQWRSPATQSEKIFFLGVN
jgi:predicted ATPase